MFDAAIQTYARNMAHVGNASSLHSAGRAARRVVEESRELIAQAFGARPSELVFTGGGTESNNLAIKGLYWSRNADHTRPVLLISSIEHHAILDPAEWLASHHGAQIVFIPVNEYGLVDVEFVRKYLSENADRVALMSVMWANNEVGTIQPIAELAALAAEYCVPMHSDAVQAAGQVDIDFEAVGLAAMTITAHKIGGPVGVGGLFVRRDVAPVPVIHGGGQERSVRSGTLDVAGISSFAKAVEVTMESRIQECERLAAMRDDLIERISEAIPTARLRGVDPRTDDPGLRLVNNVHFTFDNCEGDSLIFLLDSQGVQASTGSACQAGVPQPSHVLLAMGVGESEARGALRFSLGNTSSAQDVDLLLAVLPRSVERATAAGLASAKVSN